MRYTNLYYITLHIVPKHNWRRFLPPFDAVLARVLAIPACVCVSVCLLDAILCQNGCTNPVHFFGSWATLGLLKCVI